MSKKPLAVALAAMTLSACDQPPEGELGAADPSARPPAAETSGAPAAPSAPSTVEAAIEASSHALEVFEPWMRYKVKIFTCTRHGSPMNDETLEVSFNRRTNQQVDPFRISWDTEEQSLPVPLPNERAFRSGEIDEFLIGNGDVDWEELPRSINLHLLIRKQVKEEWCVRRVEVRNPWGMRYWDAQQHGGQRWLASWNHDIPTDIPFANWSSPRDLSSFHICWRGPHRVLCNLAETTLPLVD